MEETTKDFDPIYVLAAELFFYSHRFLTKSADAKLAEFGLGRAHFRVLHMVQHHHGIMTNQLLRQLDIQAASLNRVMKALLSDGYIIQESDLTDRRQRHHYLTKKGKDLYTEAFMLQQELLEIAFDEAGENSVNKFLEMMLLLLPEEGKELLSVQRAQIKNDKVLDNGTVGTDHRV
ncbi:MAG: MarR family winged helix-turn-helix transcriptional regulator [Sneathiella sp.]